MIEWENSRSGARIPRWNGRLMASKLDPEAEARDWMSRRTLFIDKVKTVFVLGVGGGFHIAELLRKTDAQVIVVEAEAELAAAVIPGLLERFPKRVALVCVSRAAELRSDETVRSGLGTSFVVLQHPPSIATAREFYAQCFDMLVAREWGFLNWQWRLKGFAALDSEPRVGGTEALSIYDLENTELVRDSVEREKMLLRALRELVK